LRKAGLETTERSESTEEGGRGGTITMAITITTTITTTRRSEGLSFVPSL